MLKVTIKDRVYSFDAGRYPLPEAIGIEEAAGVPFAEWQQALGRGSAKARAVFVWVVLKRDGQDVPLADILSGEYEVAWGDIGAEEEGGEPEPGPTSKTPSGSGSPPSPQPSATPRRRSES